MPGKLLGAELTDHFKQQQDFSADDLRAFYSEHGEPDLNENTLLSRIYLLKKKGIIASRKRGVFELGGQPYLSFFTTNTDNAVIELLANPFPHVRLTVWKTHALDAISGCESQHHFTIVETDKEACESVFDELKKMTTSVFLNPDKMLLQRYVPLHDQPVIIQPLITEAPLSNYQSQTVPSLEKICVDILSEPHLYNEWQGSVARDLIRNVFSQNVINFSALFRYARRRSRLPELKRILKNLNISTP